MENVVVLLWCYWRHETWAWPCDDIQSFWVSSHETSSIMPYLGEVVVTNEMSLWLAIQGMDTYGWILVNLRFFWAAIFPIANISENVVGPVRNMVCSFSTVEAQTCFSHHCLLPDHLMCPVCGTGSSLEKVALDSRDIWAIFLLWWWMWEMTVGGGWRTHFAWQECWL